MRYSRPIPAEKAIGPRGFTRWLTPDMKSHMLACCDCGLVHEVQFRVLVDDRGRPYVQFRARRAERYTRQQRGQLKRSRPRRR